MCITAINTTTTKPALFLRSDSTTLHNNTDWIWPIAMVCNSTVDDESDPGDAMPELVYESSDDEGRHIEETLSNASSDIDFEQLFREHFEDEDVESAEHSDESTPSLPCTVCSKPKWCKSYDPSKHHCKDFCTHGSKTQTTTAAYHHDAPSVKSEQQATNAALMSALMPPEIQEIAEQATKDANARTMSKKDKKKLRRACVA